MERKSWTPAELLQMTGGYWSACAVHAGVKLDVFSLLAGKPRTAAETAREAGADARASEMLLNALSALDLLQKTDNVYSATPFSAEYLSRSSDKYLGHIILHYHHLMDSWSRLDEGIQSGKPLASRISHRDDESVRESFLMGMFNLAMQLAPKIVPAIPLKGSKRLLDLGGGPGTYAIHFCLHNPGLEAVIYDLPTTRSFAEKTVARFGLSDRISFQEGDFITDSLPTEFDVAWLSHILHSEGPEGCATIIAKAVAALKPGGMILIQEFILNDAMDGPVFPALFSLNMLLGTPSGQAYSLAQLREMLERAGVIDLHRLHMELPNGAGVIAGTKPA